MCDAIAAHGAEIRRVSGNYDDAVRQAASDAAANGWHVVSDTSYDGYVDVPRDVMQGYAVIAAELVDEAEAQAASAAGAGNACPWTHVLLQGGVGGLAAAVVAGLWDRYGERRPRFVVVEPEQADCLLQSALAGRPARALGSGWANLQRAEIWPANMEALYAGLPEQYIETQVRFEDGRVGSVSATLLLSDAKTFAPAAAQRRAA